MVAQEPGFGYTIEICWCFLAADGGTRLRVSLAVVGRSRWVPRGTVERQSMQVCSRFATLRSGCLQCCDTAQDLQDMRSDKAILGKQKDL